MTVFEAIELVLQRVIVFPLQRQVFRDVFFGPFSRDERRAFLCRDRGEEEFAGTDVLELLDCYVPVLMHEVVDQLVGVDVVEAFVHIVCTHPDVEDGVFASPKLVLLGGVLWSKICR